MRARLTDKQREALEHMLGEGGRGVTPDELASKLGHHHSGAAAGMLAQLRGMGLARVDRGQAGRGHYFASVITDPGRAVLQTAKRRGAR